MVSHGNFVAYYRVSTGRQGKSGLGLEAQRAAVREHLNGGTWQVVAEFTEIESGKNADRPKLAAALKECRLRRAKLIIAKLDRLARNVAFVSNLMESGVEFEAVDFPQANRLTIHIMAAIAEHEAKMISDRTKAALAAAKRRGVKLGGYRNVTQQQQEVKSSAILSLRLHGLCWCCCRVTVTPGSRRPWRATAGASGVGERPFRSSRQPAWLPSNATTATAPIARP